MQSNLYMGPPGAAWITFFFKVVQKTPATPLTQSLILSRTVQVQNENINWNT